MNWEATADTEVKRRLTSDAALYALASASSAVASVAAVIVLTRLLAAEGYGLYAAIGGLVLIVQNAGYLAIQTSIIRFHARAGGPDGERRLATAVRVVYAAVTAAVTLVWVACAWWLGEAGVSRQLALAGLALLVLRGWLSLVQAWNRAQGRPWAYLILEAVQSFGALVLAIAVLQVAPNSAAAAVWAAAAATALAAALSPGLLLTKWSPGGTGTILREIFAYGAPLAMVFFAGAALAVSDRLLVAVHVGAAAAGAYAVAFAVADRAMQLLLLPIPLAAKPLLFAAWEREGEAGARPVLTRSARWLIGLGLPTATVLIVAPEPIASVLAGGGLAGEAARLIPWLAVGSLLSCLLSHHFSLAFQLTRKTLWMLVAMGLPALLNVAANLVLIPRYGSIAAGWTTVAAYALALTLAILLGRREVAIPFPLRTAGLALLACLPLAVFLRLIVNA
ncbi:MAG TPA: polysaccharide biosynthesis C-terminal domain-containing protein [Allosphingosinicella sp.]|jgi:O-antigen/teichoic acid export membrane protein